MNNEIVPYKENPLTALAEHSVGLGILGLIGAERLFKSKDLMERNATIRQLSADTTSVGIAWLQSRPSTEHNIDALQESGTVQTGYLFSKGERSFSRLRIHTW